MDGKKLLIALIFLLIIGLNFSECIEVERSIYAPAVINENSSQMIKISIKIIPNISVESGKIYYSLDPLIGEETQKSILTANSVARKMAEKNGINISECDVILEVSNNGVSYIEGPSAGALFTAMILSGFENKSLRSDTTMTGTVDANGRVGSVGGLPLKAEAAYKLGFKRIVFPKMTNSEKIELLMFKRYYNITMLQADDINEAYTILTSAINQSENLSLSPEQINEFSYANFSHMYLDWIKSVTENMILDAEKDINETQIEYRDNFQSRLENSKNAFYSNQYYTSANIAFLLSIDKEVSLFSKERMLEEYKKTKECLETFEKKDSIIKKMINNKNFQIIGPAETRYMWAKTKLSEAISEEEIFDIATGKQKNEFISPLLTKYSSIINAKYWCLAANHMLDKIENETVESNLQNRFKEENLRDYVKEVLKGLEVDPNNSDMLFRMKSAEAAFEEERYLSALVDAAYIKSYSDIEKISSSNSNNSIQEKIDSTLNSLIHRNYTYIWPVIFNNHAKEINKTDKLSALRIALIAENLENYYKDAEKICMGNENDSFVNEFIIGGNETEETLEERANRISAYQIVSIFTFLVGVVFVGFVILFVIGKIKRKVESKVKKRKLTK
ncbi:MAG: S16 family serine protease [Candidatus Micrarchaeia archaeon]